MGSCLAVSWHRPGGGGDTLCSPFCPKRLPCSGVSKGSAGGFINRTPRDQPPRGLYTSRAPGSLPGPPCHLWSRPRRRAPIPADAAGCRPLTQPRLPCCSSSGCVRVSVGRQRARPFLDPGASSPVTGTPPLCPWICYFLEARPLGDRKTGICFTARAAPAPGTPRRRDTPEVEGGRGGASRTDHVPTCSQRRRRCSHKWGPGRWGPAPSARHPQLSTAPAWG